MPKRGGTHVSDIKCLCRFHDQMRAFNTERSWHGNTGLTVPVWARWPRRLLNSHVGGRAPGSGYGTQSPDLAM